MRSARSRGRRGLRRPCRGGRCGVSWATRPAADDAGPAGPRAAAGHDRVGTARIVAEFDQADCRSAAPRRRSRPDRERRGNLAPCVSVTTKMVRSERRRFACRQITVINFQSAHSRLPRSRRRDALSHARIISPRSCRGKSQRRGANGSGRAARIRLPCRFTERGYARSSPRTLRIETRAERVHERRKRVALCLPRGCGPDGGIVQSTSADRGSTAVRSAWKGACRYRMHLCARFGISFRNSHAPSPLRHPRLAVHLRALRLPRCRRRDGSGAPRAHPPARRGKRDGRARAHRAVHGGRSPRGRHQPLRAGNRADRQSREGRNPGVRLLQPGARRAVGRTALHRRAGARRGRRADGRLHARHQGDPRHEFSGVSRRHRAARQQGARARDGARRSGALRAA